jgi:2-C-methyl-D-erythritol 4-phosphate cytidylyltransferase
METRAIIVAAGRGERMGGGLPKAFLAVAGVPMLVRSARAFDAAASVSAIAVVVPADRIDDAREMLRGLTKPATVVAGGERRQDSVRCGLAALPPGFDGIVLVHDAARPLVDVTLIDAVAAAAGRAGAAIPVLPVADTIKRIEDGMVRATVDRAELGAAQTPQGFAIGLLREAYAAAERDGVLLTDEAMAIERLGRPVRAIPGSALNRKVTTPDDLAWAEDVLGRRSGG